MDFRKASVADVEVPVPVVVVGVCVAACGIDNVLLIKLVGGDLTLEMGVFGNSSSAEILLEELDDPEVKGGVAWTAGLVSLDGKEKVMLSGDFFLLGKKTGALDEDL